MNRLKEVREEKGISQEELSNLAKVSRVTISNLENDKAAVSKTDTLARLADALDTTVSYLFFSS